jgi:hypothetical protein
MQGILENEMPRRSGTSFFKTPNKFFCSIRVHPDTLQYLFEVFMHSGHGVSLAGSNTTFWSHWSFSNKACSQVFYDIIKKMECRLWAAKPR